MLYEAKRSRLVSDVLVDVEQQRRLLICREASHGEFIKLTAATDVCMSYLGCLEVTLMVLTVTFKCHLKCMSLSCKFFFFYLNDQHSDFVWVRSGNVFGLKHTAGFFVPTFKSVFSTCNKSLLSYRLSALLCLHRVRFI